MPIKKKVIEDIGRPYFSKSKDTDMYCEYTSFDGKYRTIYNKKTFDIKKLISHDDNRHKKYKE